MKEIIILSPAKEMDMTVGQERPLVNAYSNHVRSTLLEMNLEQIGQIFKIKADKAQQVVACYQRLLDDYAKPAKATYQGLAFRQLHFDQLDSEFCDQHLRILSALYGPLKPSQAINPYRLDFNCRLNLGDTSLRQAWLDNYHDQLQGYRIFNLASQEFANLVNRQENEVIDIVFLRDARTQKAAPSATAKKLRGQLANYLLLYQDFSLASFKDFTSLGYTYQPELSKKQKLVYANLELSD
ncbi:hypothetical protein AWM75_05610 [Aerococcus urinaehominis]|uniref:Uncharacterized protein n=1 Tax=Aerococcus urinaehominis TaxID=128944 RepID=A0A109RGU3_9LACT|nr:YaaA family protein [Aerococcus urinaehominis]AMB99503.1 hypothetical protein AWM75_05610 [Aerococcus urinaehominis]SDM26180.1 hypothetical protein SAMN04487985_11021 [Aerococcus urinaehominis]